MLHLILETAHPYQGDTRTQIESPILSGIDESYPKAVKALKFGDKQSVDRMVIARYVAFLRFRNPWALDAIAACSGDAIKRALFERVVAGQIAIPPALDLRVSSSDAFLEDLEGIEITAGKDGGLGAMLGLSLLFVAEMLENKWRLFHSSSGGFITSDKPVSVVEAETEHGSLRYFLIPLSSHWMLQAGDGADGEIVFDEAGDAEVREGNLAVACCADRKILGSSGTQLKRIHDLWKGELE